MAETTSGTARGARETAQAGQAADALDAVDAPDAVDGPGPRPGRWARRRQDLKELPRAVKLALGSVFVMNAATYVAFPLLAVKLSTVDHATTAQTGVALTVFLLAARLIPVLAGPLADRYDPRLVMGSGAVARGVGFIGLGLCDGQGLLLVAAFLAGAGAIYEAPASALLAAQPEPIRSRAFVLENALLNAGVIGGPALAAALLVMGTRAPFVASGVLFVLMVGVVRQMGAPDGAAVGGGAGADGGPGEPEHSVLGHVKAVLRNRAFVAFWVLMLPWWFLFTQLGVAVPLRSEALAGTGWISVLYLGNGVTGMVGIGFVKALSDRLGARAMPAFGYLMVALGFGSAMFSRSPWWLLGCVVVYTVGETAILFSTQLILASFAHGSTRASYFGIYAGSWALGGTFGNFFGSRVASDPLSSTPWLVFGGVGLAAAAVSALTFTRQPARAGT
ncbi:MFS transporter [Streptomyces sp. NPDC021224]|uniref:MFS transporter n=1 Tax=unclassified Streptomyces TaxID=2593676 RepID=UPI00378A59FA